MKEQFVSKRFDIKSVRLIEQINGILRDYESQGYDLSLRQLYYQLVSKNIVENTERSYKNIGSLVSDARLAGLVDWAIIQDRGRTVIRNSHWTTPAEIVDACVRSYRVDRWLNQDTYVEVMVEKQALEGVLEPICRQFDVPFTANKGYSSSSALYEAGKRIASKLSEDKTVTIIYLGDHDPSGIDMSRDVLDRLVLFSEAASFGAEVTVNRIALNMTQVRELNPPENPAKLTDSRANDYISKFGRSSWELDAIEPRRLASLVSSAIQENIDDDAWEESGKIEETGRDWLKKMATSYGKTKRKKK